jgi:hypothetical protein
VKDKQKCCKCDGKGAKAALSAVPALTEVDAEMATSFLETVANFQHAEQNGRKNCCPCKAKAK